MCRSPRKYCDTIDNTVRAHLQVAEQLEWIIDHLSALLPYTHQIWSGVFYFKMGFDGR